MEFLQIALRPEYETIRHLALIISLFLITWTYTLKGKFLIDDIEGMERFSDTFKDGKKVDTYEHVDGDFKKTFKNTQFNRYVKMPGSLVRWLRINLGKKFVELGKNEKGHSVYGYVQDPFRHHLISLTLHLANVILIYFFLSAVFDPKLALLSTLLFTVHPVSTQAVAWISGIGYLLSLMGALSAFNGAVYLENLVTAIPTVVTGCVVSVYGLFAGAFNWVILFYIGKPWLAIASLVVFLPAFLTFGKGFVNMRVDEFKKQNMGESTIIHPKKIIVMVKTIYYYIKLVIFPKRLGLFHKWGYHYDEKIERLDWMFFKGLACIGVLGYCVAVGPPPVVFGIIWFFAYICIFSNFITAMQFVVDRYAFIPSLGYCVILSYLLLPYPVLFAFVLGLYMMRTLTHLPTYNDLLSFYRSNCSNFPNSEVALGNLGVTYMNMGRAGSAVDTWNEAVSIEPQYDVPHYNLYSIFKSNGLVQKAYEHLKQCLNAKVVHFPEQWTKEFEVIERQMSLKPLNKQMEDINERYRAIQSRK